MTVEGIVIDKQIVGQGEGHNFNPYLFLVIESENGDRTVVESTRLAFEQIRCRIHQTQYGNSHVLRNNELWALVKGDTVVIDGKDGPYRVPIKDCQHDGRQ